VASVYTFGYLTKGTFDPALEKAVLYAVGNTLVCDNLDEAKVLSWSGERFKGAYFCYFLLIVCELKLSYAKYIMLLFLSCHY